MRSSDLIRSYLKIEADRYQKSGKLRSLLIFIDLYCGSLLIFIKLIDLFQNQKVKNSDLYQAINVAILSMAISLHSMQVCPLLLCVWKLCPSKN